MLHAKSVVVEDEWCTLGSANLDACSLRHNLEANIGTCDDKLVSEAKRAFATDLRSAHEMTLASWRNRACVRRVAEQATRPLRSLLQACDHLTSPSPWSGRSLTALTHYVRRSTQ